jgi:hypothetical protein
MQFDKGVMRIFYEVTGWRSFASFTVSDDELRVFNDVYCPDVVGSYGWKLEAGELVLNMNEDPCSFGLREQNLSNQSWLPAYPRPKRRVQTYRANTRPGVLRTP